MIQKIPLRQIDSRDRQFFVSHRLVDKALRASIEKLGVVQPVVLLEGLPHIIVAGFRRVASAKALGLKEVPAVTIGLEKKAALIYAIHDNMSRGLNIVEKAHCLERMVAFDCAPDDRDAVMGLFSLSVHEKVVATLLSLASAETLLKDFAVDHDLSLKNVEYLLRFEPKERRTIIRALVSMRFTESYLREILEMLHLDRIKRGKFDSAILKGAEDSHELRTRLKKKVYPILSSLQARTEEIKRQAALPPGIDIRVDPFFEKEYIDIAIRIRNETGAAEAIRKLDEVFREGHIRSLLELTKGRVR